MYALLVFPRNHSPYTFLFPFLNFFILQNRNHILRAGFLRNEEAPYAFVVLVENGGGGSVVAGTVAGKVLDTIVNGY